MEKRKEVERRDSAASSERLQREKSMENVFVEFKPR